MMESLPSSRPRRRRRTGPADDVADELRERILSGLVPDGGELPKLDQLIDEFAVSRATARQACQILETEGLIQVRRGNVGGSSVRLPRPANVAYTLGQVLESRGVTVGDVAAAVEHFEPLCAELCAERRDRRRQVLPALEDAQAALAACIDDGDGHGASLAARRWHEALVETCGNETTTVLLGTLEAVWGAHARATSAELDAAGVRLSEKLSRRVHAEHEEIQRLIAAGDGPGAAAAAREHLRTARIHPTDRRDGNVVDALTIRDELLG
jgi:GntR family transcriptional regulator, transcriptional repressor for pyruvate dehydrogenase complex